MQLQQEISYNPNSQKRSTNRKMSDKRFSIIEKDFNKQMDICEKLNDQIEFCRRVIHTGEIVVATGKDGVETTKKLTSFQIAGYRKTLAESRALLKYEEKALKTTGNRYSEASRKNARAAKQQISNYHTRVKLVNMARSNSDILLGSAIKIVNDLEGRMDPKFQALKETLAKSPASFNSVLYKIVKSGIENQEHLKMLSASASIRALIAKEVAKKMLAEL